MYPSSNYSPNISSTSYFDINIPSPSMQYEPDFFQYFHNLHLYQHPRDQNYNLDTNIMVEENSNKLDKQAEEDQLVLQSCKTKKDEMSSTIRRKTNKSSSTNGVGAGASKKDRHSKINTARGPRDRRMRLSREIARKFFNLQDFLGCDKASKTVEWLLTKSKSAINELVQKLNKENCSGTAPSFGGGASISASSPSESCEVISGVIDEAAGTNNVIHKEQKKKVKSIRRELLLHPVVAKESRNQARARARERTKIKNSLNNNNIGDRSMVDDHQSGIQGYNANNIMNVVDNFNLVDTGNWSPFIFNYHHINNEISQEHQSTNFQYSGKFWEA
ncbi:unnamed protein product [Withania somnifera]